MKTKTIITALFILFSISSFAQKAKPNKEETVKYIEKLYKEAYTSDYANNRVVSVTCEGSVFQVEYTPFVGTGDKNPKRYYLKDISQLKIGTGKNWYLVKDNSNTFFFAIPLEEDAKRLKNALEHLIEILKTEKDDDPFGN